MIARTQSASEKSSSPDHHKTQAKSICLLQIDQFTEREYRSALYVWIDRAEVCLLVCLLILNTSNLLERKSKIHTHNKREREERERENTLEDKVLTATINKQYNAPADTLYFKSWEMNLCITNDTQSSVFIYFKCALCTAQFCPKFSCSKSVSPLLCRPININNEIDAANEKVLAKRSDCYVSQQKINTNKVCRNGLVNQPTNQPSISSLNSNLFPLLIPIEDTVTIAIYKRTQRRKK